MKYLLFKGSKQIFASKYFLYIPTEEEIELELKKDREMMIDSVLSD